MAKLVYSKRVACDFRNPLILPSICSAEHFLYTGDSPVTVWEFDSFSEAVKFVYEHYNK